MKKLFLLFLCLATILIVFALGQKAAKHQLENEFIITETQKEQASDKNIAEISVSDVEMIVKDQGQGIVAKEAENLCREVLGEKAEENGFPISYQCIGAVSAADQMYYVMNITWLVNENHWSYIGNCYVSSDGNEIYDGIASPGKYEMTALRWKK